MKCFSKSILIIAVLLIAISSFGQTVVLRHQTYTNDTIISAQRVICKANGKVRVRFGKTLTINADLIEVQPGFRIDGRGEPGVNGAPIPDWYSSPTIGNGPFGFLVHDAQIEYQTAIRDVRTGGAHGNDGSDGGNGASVYINYNVYQSQSGGPENLICITDGAKGGKGGKGVTLHCTDNIFETYTKPFGSNGINGLPGKYSYSGKLPENNSEKINIRTSENE